MGHLGTWLSGGLGSVRFMAGLNELHLGVFFQFYDSMICSCCSAIAAVVSAREGGLLADTAAARARGGREKKKRSCLQKPGRAERV